ncbi:hypothetical protein LOK49_LG14G01406 [Camellia lanceoleosa]|uniref:Uncharacterized protein n=1 Tax=Camellia lanceoleosa TaxID=1840588 RepID=A0ACC0FEB3_9ERIC|nr:hypothetical protein LOK49_LG14G01406 [Camellia lanceoleosa]
MVCEKLPKTHLLAWDEFSEKEDLGRSWFSGFLLLSKQGWMLLCGRCNLLTTLLEANLDEIEKVQQLIDESLASLKEDLVLQTLSTEDAKLVLSIYEVALMLKRNGLIKKKGEGETYFIWKMCLDIAPTDEVLYKKKVVHDAICCVCKEEEESAVHILARCQNCVAHISTQVEC